MEPRPYPSSYRAAGLNAPTEAEQRYAKIDASRRRQEADPEAAERERVAAQARLEESLTAGALAAWRKQHLGSAAIAELLLQQEPGTSCGERSSSGVASPCEEAVALELVRQLGLPRSRVRLELTRFDGHWRGQPTLIDQQTLLPVPLDRRTTLRAHIQVTEPDPDDLVWSEHPADSVLRLVRLHAARTLVVPPGFKLLSVEADVGTLSQFSPPPPPPSPPPPPPPSPPCGRLTLCARLKRDARHRRLAAAKPPPDGAHSSIRTASEESSPEADPPAGSTPVSVSRGADVPSLPNGTFCPHETPYECVDGTCHAVAAVERGACSLGCDGGKARCADGG